VKQSDNEQCAGEHEFEQFIGEVLYKRYDDYGNAVRFRNDIAIKNWTKS